MFNTLTINLNLRAAPGDISNFLPSNYITIIYLYFSFHKRARRNKQELNALPFKFLGWSLKMNMQKSSGGHAEKIIIFRISGVATDTMCGLMRLEGMRLLESCGSKIVFLQARMLVGMWCVYLSCVGEACVVCGYERMGARER